MSKLYKYIASALTALTLLAMPVANVKALSIGSGQNSGQSYQASQDAYLSKWYPQYKTAGYSNQLTIGSGNYGNSLVPGGYQYPGSTSNQVDLGTGTGSTSNQMNLGGNQVNTGTTPDNHITIGGGNYGNSVVPGGYQYPGSTNNRVNLGGNQVNTTTPPNNHITIGGGNYGNSLVPGGYQYPGSTNNRVDLGGTQGSTGTQNNYVNLGGGNYGNSVIPGGYQYPGINNKVDLGGSTGSTNNKIDLGSSTGSTNNKIDLGSNSQKPDNKVAIGTSDTGYPDNKVDLGGSQTEKPDNKIDIGDDEEDIPVCHAYYLGNGKYVYGLLLVDPDDADEYQDNKYDIVDVWDDNNDDEITVEDCYSIKDFEDDDKDEDDGISDCGRPYPKDIDGHWGEIYIRRLYDLCVVEGYEDGYFRPNANVTRAELVKMGLFANGLEPNGGCYDNDCGTPFNDLDEWQSGWVRTAWERDIVEGYVYDQFRPNQAITRAEAVKVVLSTYGYGPVNTNESFFNDVSGWSTGWIERARIIGLVQGIGNGNFDPDRPITRAEAAKIVAKMIEHWDTNIYEDNREYNKGRLISE